MEQAVCERQETVILTHGFNVKDGGAGSIDKLKPYLGDFRLLEADYGWFGLLSVRLYNDNIARMIKGMTPPQSIGIGHSNGCTLLMKACEFGASFRHLILINPALDKDTKIPLQVDRVDVLHNNYDNVVTASRFRPWHPWGEMGRTGYRGDDPRVFNHETFHLFGVQGHSEVFFKSADLAEYINMLIEEERD